MTVSELKDILDSCHPQEKVFIDADGHQRNSMSAYRVPGESGYGALVLGDDDASAGMVGGFYLYPANRVPGKEWAVCPNANIDNAACRICSKFRRTLRRD